MIKNSDLLVNYMIKEGCTHYETEICMLALYGLDNIEIGKKLFKSDYTIRNHLIRILVKLKVETRPKLLFKLLTMFN